MLKIRTKGSVLSVPLTQDELIENTAHSSAFIKAVTGIGNNAAWSACQEALDHVRLHPRFRQGVKRAFNAAVAEFSAYEHRLVYATENRLFHVDDLTPEYRKRYGNITDREYYEFWCSTGATAYVRTRQWVTSLHNKFRLSLINHHVSNPDITAWPMTAFSALKTAESIYENAIDVCERDYSVPSALLNSIFGRLNIKPVSDKWERAMEILEPWTGVYDLESTEQKNIQHGLDQLRDEWATIGTLTDSLTESISAYEEVFRTKGEQKKALRKVAEMLDEP